MLDFLSKDQYSSETLDILRLIRSENVGSRTFFSLIDFFGNPKTALENIADFSLRGGKAKPIKICSKDQASLELDALKKAGAKILTYQDKLYSPLLLEIYDPPPVLTYKVNIKLLNTKSVAIVGSRNASINGVAFAAKIASELSNNNITVVSGLARGIDTAAHNACIDRTVAVIAGGIDHIYPQENTKLYHSIADNGLIIAELPIGSKPLGQHFPQRNRIISGLSLATAIIEASLKSGSLITAKFALEQNREIFAMPGFPMDPRSQGTNKLIREGAHLLESAQDIITHLPQKRSNVLHKITDSENTNYFGNSRIDYQNITPQMRQSVLNCLGASGINLENIITYTDLPLQVIYVILLELELAGKVTKHHGNIFALRY